MTCGGPCGSAGVSFSTRSLSGACVTGATCVQTSQFSHGSASSQFSDPRVGTWAALTRDRAIAPEHTQEERRQSSSSSDTTWTGPNCCACSGSCHPRRPIASTQHTAGSSHGYENFAAELQRVLAVTRRTPVVPLPAPARSGRVVHRFCRQLHGRRAEGCPQLLDGCRSNDRGRNDWVLQQPSDRNLSRLGAGLPAERLVRFELVAHAGYARILAPLLVRPGEYAGMERAVGDQADAEGAHGGDRSSSMVRTARLYRLCSDVRPRKCRAVAGTGRGRCPRQRSCCCRRRRSCPRARVAPSPARSPPTGWAVHMVHLVQVDVVRLQPPQARLARTPDMVGGKPPIVRSEPHGLVHLRRQHDVVTVPAAFQPPSDDLFRDSVALRHISCLRTAVDVGRVEVIDAGIDRGIHDVEAGRLVRGVPEGHRAQADPAHHQTHVPNARTSSSRPCTEA